MKNKLEELEKELSQYKLTKEPPKNISVIPTGFEVFDHDILGIGGVPLGRVTQLYGPISCGKTITAYRLLAMAQRTFPDKVPAYIDTEFTFDETWATKNGVDIDNLFYKKSNRLEEVFEYVIRLAESGKVSVIIIDSLGNLVIDNSLNTKESYKKNTKGEYEYREQPGVVAKKVTLFMRQLVELLYKHQIAFISCNQIRYRIGVMYGDPTDFPGGENYRHNLSLNIQLRQIELIEENGEPVGVVIGARVKKNKLYKIGVTDENSHLRYYFENGIEKNKTYSIYDTAVRLGVIEKRGPWFKVKDGDIELEKFQGKDGLLKRIVEDEKFRARLRELCSRAETLVVHESFDAEPTSVEMGD